MGFKFIHTADWQIGKPFRGFGERTAGVLEDARTTVLERIGAAARAFGARHVLVAGDVFDAELLAERTVRPALERMSSATDLTWHLISGNHDPARPGSIWARLAATGVPGNVRLHLTPVTVEIEPGVHLLPAPLASRFQATDPTDWMDTAPTPDGAIRIGLAHGSVRSFAEADEARIPLSATRAASANLDYYALGDWHGLVEIDPRTWYSGTPEPDRFRNNSPGSVLAVEIDAHGRPPKVTALATARFSWIEIDATIAASTDLSRLDAPIAGTGRPPDDVLARVALRGTVDLATAIAIDGWEAATSARVRFLEVDRRGLNVMVGADDLPASMRSGMLADVSGALHTIAAGTDERRARVARLALQRLASYAHGADGGAGA